MVNGGKKIGYDPVTVPVDGSLAGGEKSLRRGDGRDHSSGVAVEDRSVEAGVVAPAPADDGPAEVYKTEPLVDARLEGEDRERAIAERKRKYWGKDAGEQAGGGVFRDKDGMVPEDSEGYDWSGLDRGKGAGGSTDVDHEAAVSDRQGGGVSKLGLRTETPRVKFDPEDSRAALHQQVDLGTRPKGNGKNWEGMSYVDLFERLSPYKPVSKEELEKERKKQKRDAIFSAIGDGISAMSNLYFTTQYAPDMSDKTGGMSAATRDRYDRMIKEREGQQREYMEGFLRAMAMDRAAGVEDRNWRHSLEREKVMDAYKDAADRRAEAKAERDEKRAELENKRLLHQIDEAEYRARCREIEAEYKDELERSRINKNNRTGSGGGRKGGGRTGGGSRSPYYTETTTTDTYDKDGTPKGKKVTVKERKPQGSSSTGKKKSTGVKW